MIPFLEALWKGYRNEFGELRAIRDGEVTQQFYVLPDGIEGLSTNAAILNELGADIYVGVLPRIREGGKAEDVVQEQNVVWADIDAKKVGTKAAALTKLVKFPVSPTFIVDSGHGFHGYWMLDGFITREHAQDIMKAIAKATDGDSVHDAPRVLRLPGSINWKDRENKVEARLLRFDLAHRWRVSDLDQFVVPEPPRRPLESIEPVSVADLPTWLLELIENDPGKGARSEAAFKAIVWLLRFGWKEDAILIAFRSHPNGIGAKYYEKGRDGDRWFYMTLEKAMEAA